MKFISTLVLALAASVMVVGCGKPTAAQEEKIAFDKKCKAEPTLQECKDWKDSTSN